MTIKNLICYHDPCMDGFCSAWVTNMFLKTVNNQNEFFGVNYNEQDKFEEIINKVNSEINIYILDFSFKPDILKILINKSNRLVLLDHHKTAEADLKEFIQETNKTIIRFDMNKSGARMTWEYFWPDQIAPWIVSYTEDRDLWKHQLPYSQEINTTLYSYVQDFEAWNTLWGRGKSEDGMLSLVNEGRSILRYKNKLIESLINHVFRIFLHTYEILVVNSPILQSEIAGELAKQSVSQIGACYYFSDWNTARWSLRSTPDGPDVSELAKKFGGGGHAHAAGFETKILESK